MSSIEILKALFLGAVEGFTEFLPVSSTGHLLLIGHFIGFESKGKSFEILVQLGAILAILLVYSGKLIAIARALPTSERARHFVKNVLVAFLPAMVLGGLFGGVIKGVLFNPLIVCVMLVLGGLLLIVIDDLPLEARYHDVMDLPTMTALKIGAIQCLAMIPGVSRSGATIVGAMAMGADKRTAAEFSFFLAMPTMAGAFGYDLLKNYKNLDWNDGMLIVVGFAAAFVSGLIVVRGFLGFVSKHGFLPFAWWRIIVGLAGLAGLFVYG
ncbi:MAG: undecaprenyl-diphosphate phosphatase [Rhizobiales bacterium]|nr:undecaprenyl-diphosphate phosphatase [Hyphomicrobiales bacterium]